MAKKNQRSIPQLRPRTTRSSKPRLLTDPTSSSHLLTTQLQSLGLYAAPTIGDGNCLFRALSDQVHGSPEKHRQVRSQVCDWIQQHKERYEGFVEDDDYLVDDVGGKPGKRKGDRDKGKGLEAHLKCMRENATYGGHMELSAFAHLSKRNIKVIQPGLIYVIEWRAGDPSSSTSTTSSKDQNSPRRSKRTQCPPVSPSAKQPSISNHDENQQIVKIGTGKHGYYVYEEISDSEDDDNDSKEVEDGLKLDDDQEGETVYVAYHDWEHFSSIRNLRGPHAGLPHVREIPAQSVLVQREHEKEALKEREREKDRERKEKESKRKGKEGENQKPNVMKVKLKVSPPPMSTSISLGSVSSLSSCSSLTSIGTSTSTTTTADPTLIPLPNSRSVSPFPPIPTTAIPTISLPIPATPTSPTSSIHITRSSSTSSHATSNPHPNSHLHQHLHLQHRSPKRTFDESSASGEDGDVVGRDEKRSKVGSVDVGRRSRLGMASGTGCNMDEEVDGDRDTPGLSAPGSSSSEDSSSDLTSPSPPPQVEPETAAPSVVPSPPPPSSPKTMAGITSSHSTQGNNGGGSKPLTRRQRKALGLPKQRPPISAGSGKIIIPGGKWKGRQGQSQGAAVGVVDDDGGDEEWRRNGTGRVDVRGFRELKI